MNLLFQIERVEGAFAPPPPTLTTTRKDRAMTDYASTPSSDCHKGAQGELVAAAWLIGLGYQVFRNMAPVGPGDLVAWHPDRSEIHVIDVKHVAEGTTYRRPDGSVVIPLRVNAREDVLRLIVIDGSVIGFVRSAGRSTEFHWPLQCPEIPITFQPSATHYKETQSYRLLERDQRKGWRKRKDAHSKALQEAWK